MQRNSYLSAFDEGRENPARRGGHKGRGSGVEVLPSSLLAEKVEQKRAQFLGTCMTIRPAPFSSPACSPSLSPRESHLAAFHPAVSPTPLTPVPTASRISRESFITSYACCATKRVSGSTSCFTVRFERVDPSVVCAPEKVDTSFSCVEDFGRGKWCGPPWLL